MLGRATKNDLKKRHATTEMNNLTTLVSRADGRWAVVGSSMVKDEPLKIHQIQISDRAHPLISAAIYTLQHKLDYEYLRSKLSDRGTVHSLIRHTSSMMHLCGDRLLHCVADDALANRIIVAAENSCNRIRGGLSSGEDLYRISQELVDIGCRKMMRAAGR